MRRMVRFVGVLAAVSLVVGALASCATPAPVPTPEVIKETVVVQQTVVVPATPEASLEPIKIGHAGPFVGPWAWIGQDYLQGFTLAAEQINAEGGILGHPIQVVPCDMEGVDAKSISCARKLVEHDQVVMIIDNGPTPLISMPIMMEYEVPFLLVATTSAQVSEESGIGGNEWTFRINASDKMMAEAFADYVAAGVDSISMIAYGDEYGRGAVAAVTPLLEERGVDVLSEDYFDPGEPDYRPVITRMKGANPEGVYLVIEARDAAIFMRQYHELGMTGRVFARSSVVSSEFLEATADDPSLGEGIVECTLLYPYKDQDLVTQYLARWGTMPHVHAVAAYTGLRYVAAQAIEMAIEETGEATPAAVRDALERVSVDTPIYGHLEFDEYNQAHPPVVVMTIQEGEIVLLEDIATE